MLAVAQRAVADAERPADSTSCGAQRGGLAVHQREDLAPPRVDHGQRTGRARGERGERRDARDRERRARARARAPSRGPCRSPVKLPGPDADGERVELARLDARLAQQRVDVREHGDGAARRARPAPRRRERARSSRRRRGVKRECQHRSNSGRAASSARSRSLWRVMCANGPRRAPPEAPGPASGHSTKAMASSKYGSRSPHSAAESPGSGTGRDATRRTAAVVAVADREGRARHRLRHAERAAGAADERRLPGAELAGDGHDVAGPQLVARGAPRPPPSRRARRRLRLLHAGRSRARRGRAGPAPARARGSAGGCEKRLRSRRGHGAWRGRAAPGAGGNRPRAPRASSACRARRPGGRAGRAARGLPPSVVSCSWPCTRVIPGGLPESSFVAKLPSVATTFGWISSICFQRWPRRPGSRRVRVAVAGRPALEHVRDVDVAGSGRCPRAAGRAACRPGRRTGLPACPRGSRAPRRRTSGRPRDRPTPKTTCVGPPRAGSACSPRPRRRRTPRARRGRGSVAAAAGAAAATAAADQPRLGCSRCRAPRRPRTACARSRSRSPGSRRSSPIPDELLEVRLALHADELVDRHRVRP